MYLSPSHRGKGYMSILLKTVKSEVKQQQGLELRLYVHKNNVAAVKAYEKCKL